MKGLTPGLLCLAFYFNNSPTSADDRPPGNGHTSQHNIPKIQLKPVNIPSPPIAPAIHRPELALQAGTLNIASQPSMMQTKASPLPQIQTLLANLGPQETLTAAHLRTLSSIVQKEIDQSTTSPLMGYRITKAVCDSKKGPNSSVFFVFNGGLALNERQCLNGLALSQENGNWKLRPIVNTKLNDNNPNILTFYNIQPGSANIDQAPTNIMLARVAGK